MDEHGLEEDKVETSRKGFCALEQDFAPFHIRSIHTRESSP